MPEETLILIKPDGFALREQILNMMDDLGIVTYNQRYQTTPMQLLEKHYEEHRAKPIFPWLMNYFIGKPLEVFVYSGKHIVRSMRELVGHSNPQEATLGTIRALSSDSIQDADREQRPIKNLVHCSEDLDSAIREVGIWKPVPVRLRLVRGDSRGSLYG